MLSLPARINSFISPFRCQFSTPPPPPKPLPPLPPEIWLEIFQFATYVHSAATIRPLDPFTSKRISINVMGHNTPSLASATKLALVLVCRDWRRIAVQILYQHLVIRSPSRARAILQVLQNSASPPYRATAATLVPPRGYGHWTRHIEIFTYARNAHALPFLQNLLRIFQSCPNTRIVSGTWQHPLPIEFLTSITKLYKHSLEGLYWGERARSNVTPEFLASFQSLRILDLRNFVGIDLSQSSTKSEPKPCLPRVQDLVVASSPSSLAAASALALPALRNLTMKTFIDQHPICYSHLSAFLKAHGQSLVSVDLPSPSPDSEPEPDTAPSRRIAKHVNPDIFLEPGICPNLTTLTFPTTSPPLSSHVSNSIRRIGLRGVRADSLYPDKSTNTKAHLLSFTTDRYPNLEVVRTIGFLVDADTDTLIKDIFIWWAEKFEKQGIDFLDGEGVLWVYTDPIETPEVVQITNT